MSRLPADTAFLFDIGNVILFFDFTKFARAIEADCRFTAAEIIAEIDSGRQDLEANTMDTETFLRHAFEMLEYQGTREQFVEAWQHIFEPNEGMMDLITKLEAAGHRLILLSNTNQLHVDHFMPGYPVFSLFHEKVFSHEVGAMKPDPVIFEHAIREHGLRSEKTIYLDDMAANVEGGRAAGLKSILYSGQSVAALEAEFKELVGVA